MTDPSTKKISIISHWCPTAFAAVYQCYFCIFLISETDIIAARFIKYKMVPNKNVQFVFRALWTYNTVQMYYTFNAKKIKLHNGWWCMVNLLYADDVVSPPGVLHAQARCGVPLILALYRPTFNKRHGPNIKCSSEYVTHVWRQSENMLV